MAASTTFRCAAWPARRCPASSTCSSMRWYRSSSAAASTSTTIPAGPSATRWGSTCRSIATPPRGRCAALPEPRHGIPALPASLLQTGKLMNLRATAGPCFGSRVVRGGGRVLALRIAISFNGMVRASHSGPHHFGARAKRRGTRFLRRLHLQLRFNAMRRATTNRTARKIPQISVVYEALWAVVRSRIGAVKGNQPAEIRYLKQFLTALQQKLSPRGQAPLPFS